MKLNVGKAGLGARVNNMANNEWITPRWLIDDAKKVLGPGPLLDPASSALANRVIQADKYYTSEEDGLGNDTEWSGKIWLNPPYSRELCRPFCFRACIEYKSGNITEGMTLLNNATETQHVQLLIREHYSFCLFNKRIKFLDKNLVARPGGRYGQVLFYLGCHVVKFHNVFSKHGSVCSIG